MRECVTIKSSIRPEEMAIKERSLYALESFAAGVNSHCRGGMPAKWINCDETGIVERVIDWSSPTLLFRTTRTSSLIENRGMLQGERSRCREAFDRPCESLPLSFCHHRIHSILEARVSDVR